MSLPPPPLVRIAAIDRELTSLYGRVRVLLDERGHLVAGLQPAAAYPAYPEKPVGGVVRPARETSPVTVQTLLLALGALLLGTASLVFLAVAWSRAGVAGRSVVLLALTAAALTAPRFLLRRSLAATAETLAAVGLLLCALDAWAAWRLDLVGISGLAYTALVTAALSAGAYAYSLALPLRGPRLTAVVLAQLPLPLLALAADAPPAGIALALLGTVLVDALLVRLAVARPVALGAGATAWASAVLIAVPAAYAPSWPAASVGALAGLLALGAAVVAGPLRPWVAGVAVLELAAVAVGTLRVPVGDLLAPALVGVAVIGVAALLPGAWRRGTLAAGGVVLGLTALVPLGAAVGALALPAAVAALPWTGIGAVPASVSAAATATVLVVALLVTGGTALAAVVPGRPALVPPVLAGGVLAAALIAPVAFDLPLWAMLAGLATLTVLASAVAARATGWTTGWAFAATPVLAGLTAAWSLATRPATLTVLGGLAVLAAGVAGAGRLAPVRVTAAAVCVLALAGEATAVPLATGASVRVVAFLLLALVAAVAGTAAVLRAPRLPESRAAEVAALPVAAAALAFASTRGWSASLAFGLLGATLLAVSLRPDRRAAAYAGAASVQIAGWIALGTAGVAAPEAYTGPLTALLLGIGLLRRRTGTSSWSAYAPGLLVTAVPSLLLALDEGGPRTLLLAGAALVVVLLGARARLQAPLAIGATVLVLLALNEVGPALLGVLGDLPRWVPPAVGGALLLAVGSTYERRLRDLRRARAAFDRLG